MIWASSTVKTWYSCCGGAGRAPSARRATAPAAGAFGGATGIMKEFIGCGSVSELAQDAGKFGAVGRAEAAEDAAGFGPAGGADLGQDVGAVRGHLDQGGAPVGGVGAPPDQIPGLQC